MAPNFRAAAYRCSFALAALSTCAITGSSPALSEPGAAELGVWINHTGRGAVELYKCGTSACGRIVWVKDPKNAAGKPRTDINNPDPSRRNRAICGLVTFSGLKRTAGGWGDGQGYNPEDGTSFNVSIQLSGPNSLKVTGSKLIFSKTVYWKRPTSEVQRCDRPAVPATPPPQIAAPKPPEPAVPAKAAVTVEAVDQVPPAQPPKAAAAPPAMPSPPVAAAPPAKSEPAPVKSAANSPAPMQATPVTTTATPVAPIVKPVPPKPSPAIAPAPPAKQPVKSANVTPPPQPAVRPAAVKPAAAGPLQNPAAVKPAATALPAPKTIPAVPPGQLKQPNAVTANAAAPPPNGGWPITGSGPKPALSPAPNTTAVAAPAEPPVIAPVAKKPPRKKPEIFDGTTIPMPVLR